MFEELKREIQEMPTISFNANDVYKADVLKIIDKYAGEPEAKWVPQYGGVLGYLCSRCGNRDDTTPYYCSNCGAKMNRSEE